MQDNGVERKQKSWKRCFCGSTPAKDDLEGEVVTPVKESGREPENLPRRFSLKKSLSKLSSVSSNVSFYTARENADSVQSHSSRISQDSLAELDALGAEAEQSRTLGSFPSKRRSESINKKAELSLWRRMRSVCVRMDTVRLSQVYNLWQPANICLRGQPFCRISMQPIWRCRIRWWTAVPSV